MRETEPRQVYSGKTYEVQLFDDDEEIDVVLKSNGSWILGIIGPLSNEEYPELFSDKVSQRGVDRAARKLIRDIISYSTSDFGLSQTWSDDFPIGRYFPYRSHIRTATILADLLRGYLVPSGDNGAIIPGDITKAIESCLRDRVDPKSKVDLELRTDIHMERTGKVGLLWGGKKDNEWIIEVDARDEIDTSYGTTFIEGHEAGHLLLDYFAQPKTDSAG